MCSPSNHVEELFSGHEHTEEKEGRERKRLGEGVIVRQSHVGEAGTLSGWKQVKPSPLHTRGKGAVEGRTCPGGDGPAMLKMSLRLEERRRSGNQGQDAVAL